MSSVTSPLPEIYPGLYLIAAPGSSEANGSPLWVYFLTATSGSSLAKTRKKKAAAASAPEVTLQSSWDSISGWYFFTPQTINPQQAPAFIRAARKGFPPLSGSSVVAHNIVWLTRQDAITAALHCIYSQKVGQFDVVTNESQFNWSGLSLTMQSGLPLALIVENGYPSLQLSTSDPGDADLIGLQYYQVTQTLGYRSEGWLVNIWLDGPAAGSFNFSVGLNIPQLLSNFGGDFHYVPGTQLNKTLAYPLYDPTPFQPGSYCAFEIWLNPLLPRQTSATRFQLDTTGRIGKISWQNQASLLKSDYFYANDGATLRFQPVDPWASETPTPDTVGAGFAFSWRPVVSSPPSPGELYLSPVGDYRVTRLQSPSTTSALQVMPGLFTREYFRINSDDILRFVADQPARAGAFSLQLTPDALAHDARDILDATYTTSWAQWYSLPAEARYYGQPASAPFFGDIVGAAFPIAIDVLLETFTTSVLFPWVPYGGLDESLAGSGTDLMRFEATVIGAVRHGMLTEQSGGPIFMPQNTTEADPGLRSATTPQSLLFNIDEQGSLRSLTLSMEEAHSAASPPEPQSFLRFSSKGSPSRVPTDLALTLTQNQLFYVVTVPGDDWAFDSTTWLGGFQFNMGFGEQDPSTSEHQTIMVFKFNTTATLAELCQQHTLWTGAQRYNTDPAKVSGSLIKAIDFARSQAHAPDNPFENFNRIVNDSAWTGVLFFNAAIDGNGMPPDLQMLLGGINGGLRAHHVGIQGNMFDHRASPAQLGIKKSSLFGVIFYDENSLPPNPVVQQEVVDYEVETLIVVFSHSAVAQFNTTVGLTLNQLFSRNVALRSHPSPATASNPNTLSIKGKYQTTSDGVGRVVFTSDNGFIYDIVPASNDATYVVKTIRFDNASLVPVSSTPSGSPTMGTCVKAQFVLGGQLWFNAAPFPISGELDLFSYGQENTGLPISGLTTHIEFTLDAAGNCISDSKKVTLDMSTLNVQPKNEAIRPDSLLYSIPLKFSRFLSATDGKPLNASTLGATTVNILQLEGHLPTAGALPPPASPEPPQPAATLPVSYATSSARYGLEYDMQLGSLGALGANARLNAKVILGWGPSATVPDNDAAALFVQLPQLSAGAGGFELEGILKTTFGAANLLKVDLKDKQQTVYAFLFNNIQLSVFGYRFPPGVLIDFLVFAGAVTPGQKVATNTNNLAWFLSAQPQKKSP